MVAYSWTCSCCGRQFSDLPTCWGFGAGPDIYEEMSEAERDERVVLTPDVCVIDDRHRFVRGHIEIPIIGSDDPFVWNVWVSLSEQSFEAVERSWEDQDRVALGPFFGWLCSHLPYPWRPERLKTSVRLRPPGEVPLIEVAPSDHPLAVEQRDGMTIDRVVEIAEMLLPRH